MRDEVCATPRKNRRLSDSHCASGQLGVIIRTYEPTRLENCGSHHRPDFFHHGVEHSPSERSAVNHAEGS
jgi:hypothetical protein